MSFQIRAEILGNMDSFAKAMTRSQKQLKGLEKMTKNVSKVMKSAMVGGILMGLDAVWDGMKKLGKAAAEEAQSMTLLRHAMNKSWKATDKMAAQNEDFIKQMSYMTAIADDKLRPAYAKIVRVTKNSTKAQKAFTMALDISAATGKDVNVVSQAMAKYLGGNKTALDKLVPGLSNVSDKMKYLKDTYAGAAKEIGNQKPFERIQIIFEDIQERLGSYILPYVQQFADWLAGPEAQQMIEDMFTSIQNMFDYLQSEEGKKTMQSYVDGFKEIAKALLSVAKALSQSEWFWKALGAGMDFTLPSVIGRVSNGGPILPGVGEQAPPPVYTGGAMTGRYQTGGIKVDVKLNGKDVISVIRREAAARGVTPVGLLSNG